MTENEINQHYSSICQSVLELRLKKAFDTLTILLAVLQKGEWLDKKTELEQNYMYLLHYAVDGVRDDSQELIIRNLQISILKLADKAVNALKTKFSSSYVYQKKRLLIKDKSVQTINIDKVLSKLGDIDNQETQECEREQILNIIFNRLWLKALWTDTEVSLSELLFVNNSILEREKCVIISAITLSLMEVFDESKFDALITAYQVGSDKMKVRAIIALIITISIHNERISLYQSLLNKITRLRSDSLFMQYLVVGINMYINCLETEKINNEIKNEILPELIKNSPINLNNVNDLSYENIEVNPEWTEKVEKIVSDKLKRFSKLQKKGADIFMNTFSSMKHFPFFETIENWFMPFDKSYKKVKEFYENEDYKGSFSIIVDNPMMCDSDRYSLLFSLDEVPDTYKQNLSQNLSIQNEELKELNKINETDEHDFSKEIQRYWQDLYRFFVLYRYRDSFINPFSDKVKLYNSFIVESSADNLKIRKSFADFYLNNEQYDLAITLFNYLEKTEKDNVTLLQKKGYCYQKLEDYENALKCYLHSTLIESNNSWTDKMIGFCYNKQKKYDQAIIYYKKILTKTPDDVNALHNVAQCHICMQQYDQALQLLFKIDYLSSGNTNIWREIALSAFNVNKIEQADNYMTKIRENKECTIQDFIFHGCIAWCNKDLKRASLYFKDASDCQAKSKEKIDIFKSIISYKDMILSYGISEKDFILVTENIAYEI